MIASRSNTRFAYALNLVFAVIAAAIVFVASPKGEVIVTPDAVQYLAAARSLADGHDYVGFEGAPYTEWPPLYPTLLAPLTTVSEVLNVNLLDVIRFANALTAAATVFTGGLLLLRSLSSAAFALLGTAAILLARPYLITYVHAFSEPLAGLLTILLALQLATVLKRPGWGGLVLLIVIAALGALQRYMGLAFIPGAALCLVLFMREPRLMKRLTDGVIFGAGASLPLALWLLRNYQLAGYWIRPVSFSTPLDSFDRGILFVPTWISQAFMPATIASAVNPLLGLVLLLAIAVLASVALRREPNSASRVAHATPVAPLVVMTVVYIAVLLVFTTRTQFGALEPRFLSPIYVFMIAILLSLAERLTRWLGQRLEQTRLAYTIGLVGAALVVIFYPAQFFAQEMQHLANWCCKVGQGHELSLIVWIGEHELDGTRYSNLPMPLYYNAGYTQQVPESVETWSALAAQTEPTYLIWFTDAATRSCSPTRYCREADYTLQEITRLAALEPLVELDDGGVYRVVGMP